MAYERNTTGSQVDRVVGDSLDAFVSNTMKMFGQQIDLRNADEEAKFFKTIADNRLTLEDQLVYRKQQLKTVQDDPAERKRLRQEISDLTARVEQKQFSDEYLGQIADVNAGVSSVDSVLSWLKDQRESATDATVIANIDKFIADNESTKFNLTQTLLKNQTDYAVKDKTSSIINAQISRVSSVKAGALLSGNDSLASTLDLQLQQLQQALSQNDIEKDIKNFAVSSITGNVSAKSLLDAYNSKITSSAPTGPVVIAGTTYSSAQEFWKYKRDSYLADNSSNGFFAQFNNEVNTDLKVKNSQNSLTPDDIKNAAASYNSLVSRPELQNFLVQINTNKQDTIQTGTDLVSKKILNTYSLNYDLPSAVNNLNALKSIGGNVDDTYTSLITSGANVKKTAIDSILSTAQTLLSANPGMTPQEALQKAMASGAGVTLSPEQLATTPESKITGDFAIGAGKSAFGNDARTTSPQATATPGVTPPPIVPPAPVPAPVGGNQNSSVPASPTPTPSLLINKQLDFGATDPQVRELQKFLNSKGFTVSSAGAGSAGNETDYFGPLTQAALKKYQAANNIVNTGDAATTGYGRLGPQTLASIQKLLA